MDETRQLTVSGKRQWEAATCDGLEINHQMELRQRALVIATIVLKYGRACGFETLQQKCRLFNVSSHELHALCELSESPLQLMEDNKIGLTGNFLVTLRSHLEAFERGNNGAGTHCNVGTFLVPPVPSTSFVGPPVDKRVKDGAVQDLDKQKPCKPKRIPEFKDYIVLGEEGSGGYGTVYRVKRKRDNQLFAIKCPLEKTTEDYVNHEIKMLQRIGGQEYITSCEDVILEVPCTEMEDVTKENQRPNLVLRYIEHDKPEILRKEITVQELQLYGYCLFRALAYLHKQGIVHRDVKPGNFLFSRTRGTGYLVDFNLALVTQTSTSASAKTRKPGSNPFKGPAKGDVNRDIKSASSRKVLGKRVRKEEVRDLSKRHQNFPNIHGNETGCSLNDVIPQVDILSREAISPDETQQACVSTQCTLQSTTTVNPRVNGGATQLNGEETSKKSAAVDSSSKATVIHDSVAQPHRPRQSRRSLKPVNTSRERDGGPPSQSALGELAWMPQTVGVLRFAQYFKNRSQTQATTTTNAPPASQRKRVAAIQHKNRVVTRPPASPPKPSNKGAGVRRNLPKDGPCAGTKGYRAPEVLLKSNMQTTKLDIWSAGVSLLQLIAGKAPFPSSSSEQALRDIAKLRGVDDLLKLAGAHDCLHKLPPGFETLNYNPLSVMDWCSSHARRPEMRDRLPPVLCDLLEKCLQVDPNIRIEASEALGHEFFNSVRDKVAHDPGFSPSTVLSV